MVTRQWYINVFYTQWGKSVVAKTFIRNLKNIIYKYMTAISKNMYIDKLDDMLMNAVIYIVEQSK